jgi:hypothetical protein
VTAVFNFYLPLIAMIAINTKIYMVIRKRYHNPIMQYTVGPSSSYRRRFSSSTSVQQKNAENSTITNHMEMNKLKKNENNTRSMKSTKSSSFELTNERNASLKSNKNQSLSVPYAYETNENKLQTHDNALEQINKGNCNKHASGRKFSSFAHDGFENGQKKKESKNFMKKQEKAFSQLAAIVIGFTICFMPYFVIFMVVALCPNCVNTFVFELALWLGYVNSTINPFLYTLSSQRFKNKFKSSKNINIRINNYNLIKSKNSTKK